jgi:hypothetical protein
VVWAYEEDVTHPERFSLPALTSELLNDVLERAGRRVANELVYARGGLLTRGIGLALAGPPWPGAHPGRWMSNIQRPRRAERCSPR